MPQSSPFESGRGEITPDIAAASASLNPYQAPLSDGHGDVARPDPADLLEKPLDFRGRVSRQDHRNAVRRAHLRTDYRGQLRVMSVIVLTLGSITLLLIIASSSLEQLLSRSLSMVAFAAGVLTLLVRNRWLTGTFFPDLQFAVGELHGRLATKGLLVESDEFRMWLDWKMLVASSFCGTAQDRTHPAGDGGTARGVWAFCFMRQYHTWITLPFEGFEDPDRARAAAAAFQHWYPPKPPQATDSRRWQEPTQPASEIPTEDSVEFSGEFYERSLHGSQFMEQSKQLDRGTWYSLAICLLCFTLGIVLLLGPQPELFVGAALWVAILVGAVWVKLYLVRRRSQRRQGRLLWHSKGWLDDRGFFSMTTLGQTFVKWSMIGAVEITDQLIGLKPHGYEHTAFLVGRNQFGSDTDWNRALEIVHRQTDR